MVSVHSRTFLAAAFGLTLLLQPAFTLAQSGVNEFFAPNAVDDFTVPVVDKEGIGFQYFLDVHKKAEVEEEAQAEAAPAPAAKEEAKQPEDFESGEDVLAAYGDPAKDVPVLAQENAPKPFKAMMAAFEAGDDKLAYGYARQWVRYMDNLQTRTSRVVEAARAAQVGEKVVSGGAPEAERMKQTIMNDNAHLAANLDPRASEILAKAQADEAASQGKPQNDVEQQELKAREVIRKQIAGRIPVDPKGKVDMYLFFAPNDPNAKSFAPVANQIYQRVSLMKNVNIAAFSTARLNSEALKREQHKLGLNFNLMAGDGFARELQLTKFPAIVFSSPSTGKLLKETGDKPFIFYDELIAAMQGRVR